MSARLLVLSIAVGVLVPVVTFARSAPALDALPQPTPAATPKVENVKTDSASSSGPADVPPEKAKPVTIPRFDKPPVIDGKLDDAVWRNAAVLKDFLQIQPGDNLAPSKPTEVMIGYDPKFLYVAFKAIDEPNKIRATTAGRSSSRCRI